jgi:hypothetical protein
LAQARECKELLSYRSARHMVSPNASGVSTSDVPGDLRVDRRRCDPRAGSGASGGKGGLLREDEDGGAGQRLRPSCAEVGPGKAVLRKLRVLPRHTGEDHFVCLSAHRRGIFCHGRHSRARPLAPSTCSTAARLSGWQRWLIPRLRDEGKETQQENSMKYLLMIAAAITFVGTASATSSADCCGGGACCPLKLSCCAK